MFNRQTKIALVGVSAKPEKYGHRIFADLLDNGYQVIGINPKAESVLNQPIFSSLSDLPTLPELVITVVPHSVTSQIVDECHNLGIKNIWMQPGSESLEVVEKAKQLGLQVTTKCFMKDQGIW